MTVRFSRLDRTSIGRLTAGASINEHGISAERLVDGDLRWTVNVMVDGRRIHRAIGKESDGVTRTQCEEFIEQARTDARAARLNLPKGRKLALLFDVAADNYIKRLETDERGKNVKVKKRQVKANLKPFFGTMRLDGISSFAIERYKKKRAGEGAAAATVNRELATLSHILNKAVEWGWVDHVQSRPRKEKEGPGRIIALTDQQCDDLMRAAVAGADPDCYFFIAFGLNTAMRHAEILAARWEQLDLDARRLFIPNAKAGAREQPITPELADLLRRERAMRDKKATWIFPSPHKDAKTGHRVRMDGPFRAAVTLAGLDSKLVTPHVMRHTAITKLVQSGADLPTIQRISGHKTLAMVMRYSHVHGRHIDDAIKAIGRSLPELPANKAGSAVTPELHKRTSSRAQRQATR